MPTLSFLFDNPALVLLMGVAALIVLDDARRRRRPDFIGVWPYAAGAAWLLYGFWEVVVVGPEDSMRVDLVIIYPILLVLTGLGISQLLAGRRRKATKAAIDSGAPIPPPTGEPLA